MVAIVIRAETITVKITKTYYYRVITKSENSWLRVHDNTVCQARSGEFPKPSLANDSTSM